MPRSSHPPSPNPSRARPALLTSAALLAGAGALTARAQAPAPTAVPVPARRTFTAVGTAAVQAALDAFRAAIGGADNGEEPSQASGRREVDWDDVALDGSDFGGHSQVIVPGETVGLFINRYQPRGIYFGEYGAVSGDGFAGLNPGAAGQFAPFSGGNVVGLFDQTAFHVSFGLPSAPPDPPVPAAVRGFGAVFLDAERARTSGIECFDRGKSLGRFPVPPGASGQPEFVGVLFDEPVVTDVALRVGQAPVFQWDERSPPKSGKPDLTLDARRGVDLVALDNLVYSEPAALSGSGRLQVTPAGLTFTQKGSRASAVRFLRVRNRSNRTLIGYLGKPRKPFTGLYGCGFFKLSRGRSHQMAIQFDAGAPGSYDGAMEVTSTDPARPLVEVKLHGERTD